MTIKQMGSLSQLTPDAFANNDGTHFSIYVRTVKRQIVRGTDGERDALTISFDLEKQNCKGIAKPIGFKDGRFRSDLATSKKATMQAFEQVLDTLFAMEAANVEVIDQ